MSFENKNLTIEETFNLAIKNHQKNKIDLAQELYGQVLKINPNHLQAHYNLGLIFRKLGEFEKAKDCYENAIKINPNYSDAHKNLGIILYNLGEKQKAKDCYEKVIETNPNDIGALNNLGAIFLELGEYQKAKDCYEKVIEIDSNHIDALNNLGVIFNKLGEFEKAKDFYENVIKIDPNYIKAHNNLGIIFNKLGEFEKAKDCYENVIKIDPNYLNAYNNLAIAYQLSKEYIKALKCLQKAIKINPNNINLINNLTSLLGTIVFDIKIKADKDNLKKTFLFLFRKNNVEHKLIAPTLKLSLFSTNEQNQLFKIVKSKSSLLKNKFIQNFLKDELLNLMLQKSLISQEYIEELLTRIRYEILFTLGKSNRNNLKQYLEFIISLAEQCWLNEYVYIQSKKEINEINKLKNKVATDKKINELEVAILGCYVPLNRSKIIINKLINYKSKNILFNDLITVQIKEPLKEQDLVKSIKSLSKINDPISKKVQAQYEEHPYPRWRCIQTYLPFDVFQNINENIKPNKIDYNNKFNIPNVLVAGCGTGYHSISTTCYKNSNILAVDLSLTSLAYAKRKTEELGLNNIEYLHADILHLKKLNRKFDIIESAGTLHHMKNPLAGLRVLVDILEPHGFLKIGLYSEFGRKNVVKAREFIKKNNFKNSNEDIKIFRQLLIDQKENQLLQELVESIDFYSTSSVRDLLFHVQEHRFKIPQISKILKDFNLEFLGFITKNPETKIEYSKLFPNDKENISLNNWHQFEINNPGSFSNMYHFWVRKQSK